MLKFPRDRNADVSLNCGSAQAISCLSTMLSLRMADYNSIDIKLAVSFG